MAYVLGADKELDKSVLQIRKHIPGFFPGCEMQIVNIRGFPSKSRYIGARFISQHEKSRVEHMLNTVINNRKGIFDPTNQYEVNLGAEDVEVTSADISSLVALEDTIEGIAKFIPGYTYGCVLEVIKQPSVGNCKIGDKFDSVTKGVSLEIFLESMIHDRTCSVIDPKNTYSANYQRGCLVAEGHADQVTKAASPELVLGKFNKGDVVVSLATMHGSRTIGDMFTVLSTSTKGSLYYGTTWSMDVTTWRIATPTEAERFKNGDTNIHDKDWISDLDLFSDGYRIKTIDELCNEFGDLMSVPKAFVSDMYHLAGLPITNDFAKRIVLFDHSRSDDMVFKGVKDSDKTYDWSISYAMITKSPLLSVTTAEINPYTMGGVHIVDYPEKILDKSSKTNKVEFISDFTTTQLKPKTKRLKLSIN